MNLGDLTGLRGFKQRRNKVPPKYIKAYIAGLIDGEGTITLTRHKKNEFRSPVVSMVNTDKELLAYIRGHYGGSMCSQKTYKSHHKQAWTWNVSGNRALALLRDVMPFLRSPRKHLRCMLLLHNYKKCTKRNGRYSEAELKIKYEFEEMFFAKTGFGR